MPSWPPLRCRASSPFCLISAKTQTPAPKRSPRLLASEPLERAAAFAFVTYPAAAQEGLPIGAEGINDLAKVATPILSVDGEITWQERRTESNTKHPEVSRIAEVIRKLRGPRRERAKQFFSWCLLSKVIPEDLRELESEMESCVKILKKKGLS